MASLKVLHQILIRYGNDISVELSEDCRRVSKEITSKSSKQRNNKLDRLYPHLGWASIKYLTLLGYYN